MSTPTNIINKITEGFSIWIGMLTGKPRSSLKLNTPATNAQPTVPPIDPDDPVAKDVAKAKEASQKVLAAVEDKLKPFVSKDKIPSVDSIVGGASKYKRVLNGQFFKKIAISLSVLILVVMIGLWGMRFMSGRQLNGIVGQETASATPTPAEFVSTQPSVYAVDKTILEIEEKLIILDRQIDSTSIKEPTLNPPELDFAISF